ETVVKLYRGRKRAAFEQTLEDWGDDFWRFVRSFGPIKERERVNNIEEILASVLEDVVDHAVYHAYIDNVSTTSKEYHAILLNLVQQEINAAYASGQWASKAFGSRIIDKYWRTIIRFAEEYKKDKKLHDNIIELCVAVLLQNFHGSHSSGVVIAGFGQKDIF